MTIEKILDDCANTIRQQEAALLAEQKHNEMLMAEIEQLKNRELTDEEIDYITKKYFNIHPDAKLSEQFKIKLYELKDFAKAILKKASDK
jgi:hypothetical protein